MANSYQLLSAITVPGTGENCVSRTRKSLWGKGISSQNNMVPAKEKSVMVEVSILREGVVEEEILIFWLYEHSPASLQKLFRPQVPCISIILVPGYCPSEERFS